MTSPATPGPSRRRRRLGHWFVLLGYLAGNSYATVEKTVGRGAALAVLAVLAVLALLLLAVLIWRLRKRRAERRAERQAVRTAGSPMPDRIRPRARTGQPYYSSAIRFGRLRKVTIGVTGKSVGTPRRGWIHDWHPEDPDFWERTGRHVARRNLVWSILSEHIGFSVWTLWSVFVLFLGPEYGIDPAGKFLLTALPALVGSVMRIPYTLAVAKFGGRNWTVASALLLLVPCVAAALVLEPGVDYGLLLVAATLAGVGGGNFASSMANINAFYPQRQKGWALGLNAGGGNLGVAAVQLIGLAVLATAGAQHPRLVLAFYIPMIVVAALGAALFMDNLTVAMNDKRALRDATHDAHTWVMSFLYIGTFGSFIGFGFAFGQVLQVQFKTDFASPVDAAYLTFLGPLLGSLIRPVGGWLADRLGGARVTLWNFAAMAASAATVLVASRAESLSLFLGGFIALFVFSGVGNGSTYKMIPAIFKAKAALAVAVGTDPVPAEQTARRLSGALIGIAGAVGALGGVLVNLAFRQSFQTFGNGDAAYLAFIAFYLVCVAVTWTVYLRPGRRLQDV